MSYYYRVISEKNGYDFNVCNNVRDILYNTDNVYMLAAPSLGKTTNNSAKLEIMKAFSPFAWVRERASIKVHSIKSRFVIIRPSNVLSACAYVYTIQPGNFTRCGNEGVKLSEEALAGIESLGDRGGARLVYTYVTLQCLHHNDSCIKMVSGNGSHFNVSLTVRGK